MLNEQFIYENTGLFILLTVWSIIWKGLSLWKASHKESKPWFIVLLVLNTFGILDILYIYVFSKMGANKDEEEIIEVEKVEEGEK